MYMYHEPFNNWTQDVENLRAHSQSDGNIQSGIAGLAADTAIHQCFVIQQLQRVQE